MNPPITNQSKFIKGQILESLQFKSKVLDRSVAYSIYLPSDYEPSNRRYPVLYLLHGYGDNEIAWVQFGEIHNTVDNAIESGEIPPMIIVMPAADSTYYVNDYRQTVCYEDMFIEELLPLIDFEYRTRAKKEFRAIAGFSMGGFGALMYAMRHYNSFGSCAVFNSAILTDDELAAMDNVQYDHVFSELFGGKLRGQDRINEHWHKSSPIQLAQTLFHEKLKKVNWYIDCGDNDTYYKGNSGLHIILRERHIPHKYRVRDGYHNWSYCRNYILEGLRFIGGCFHR